MDAPPADTGGGGDTGTDAPSAPIIPDHLVISEVSLRDGNREFIEIFNPTKNEIDLSNYYLTDDHEYFKLAGIVAQNQVVGRSPGTGINVVLAANDFIARFPDGAKIPAATTAVIALKFESIVNSFGVMPQFAFTFTDVNNDLPARRMRPVPESTVPTIDEASIELTNEGEGIVLFHWDQTSDRVEDVDMLHAGTPDIDPNKLELKTGKGVDGPDADTTATAYLRDELTLGFLPDLPPVVIGMPAPTDTHSFHRIAFELGEKNSGGNGITGHDETSEKIGTSWINNRNANPGIAPELCQAVGGTGQCKPVSPQ